MKTATIICAVLISSGAAQALDDVPDPDLSSIEPWDDFGRAFVAPGGESPLATNIDAVTITVVNSEGNPIIGAPVLIDFAGGAPTGGDCANVCIDPIDAGLEGVTGADGTVTLNPAVGGCDDCTVIVRASGVTIGFYNKVVSTDWNGATADGSVTGADFAFFATSFNTTQDDCADYNGDGGVSGLDFSLFATSFNGADANPNGCQ